MASATFSVSDVLLGIAAPLEHTFRNRILGLVSLMRLGFGITLLPMVLGVAALAGIPVTDSVLLPVCVVAILAGGVVTGTNDIIDAQRDKEKWPKKPLASGLISKSGAVLFTAILLVLTLAIARLAVSWLFAVALLTTMVLNYVYSAYSRDKIGYVTAIFPSVTLPVLVFIAVSPSMLLATLAWATYVYFAAGSIAIQITHEALDPTIPALFVRPRALVEEALYVVSVIIWLLVSLWMFSYAHLSWLWLVPVAVFTVWILSNARFLGKTRIREKLESAYKLATLYYICIFWISIALFVWIPQNVGV